MPSTSSDAPCDRCARATVEGAAKGTCESRAGRQGPAAARRKGFQTGVPARSELEMTDQADAVAQAVGGRCGRRAVDGPASSSPGRSPCAWRRRSTSPPPATTCGRAGSRLLSLTESSPAQLQRGTSRNGCSSSSCSALVLQGDLRAELHVRADFLDERRPDALDAGPLRKIRTHGWDAIGYERFRCQSAPRSRPYCVRDAR